MFGFHFLENFNYPYISGSIREFWRRWHISLSTFLRDYLYIPLGGSRAGPYKTYRNLIIVFFLCGLWHGAGWTFILWGLYFGFFLILERLFLGKVLDKIHPLIAWVYAMVVVMFSWLLFRAETIDQFLAMLTALFEGAKTGAYKKYAEDSFLQVTLVLACIGATPLFRDKVLEAKRPWIRVLCDIFLFCIFLVSVAYLAAGTYNPFIYFRF
jgi:alginate O-acetyltransferase complex protein AlgI